MRVVALIASVLLAGCGAYPAACGPGSCDGCCADATTCLTGTTSDACGFDGEVCHACPPDSRCIDIELERAGSVIRKSYCVR